MTQAASSNSDIKTEVHSLYESRPVNPHRIEAIRKFAGASVLDVGCGNGQYVFALAGEKDIRGVDLYPFDSWKRMPGRFGTSEGSKLGMPDGSVDTVTAFELLEHLKDPMSALREYHRVCRKNLILTVPNCEITSAMKKSNLIYGHWEDRTHIQFFRFDELKSLIESAGFKVRHAEFINKPNFGDLFSEIFRIPVAARSVVRRIFSLAEGRRYYLTILIVAEKT